MSLGSTLNAAGINRALRILAMLTIYLPAIGQENAMDSSANPTLFDHLIALNVEKVKLYVGVDSVVSNKFTDKEHQGEVQFLNNSGEVVVTLPLDVSVRSKSRRRYCSFPPLKFDFVKSVLDSMGLARHDDYKIVTHCLDETADQSHLLKEYMIYQIYQILTPLSHRALMVDIEYHCTDRDSIILRKAVILDSFDELAEKNEGVPCDCMGTPVDSIHGFYYELVAMLQYMVGNADMDHRTERNVKFIKPNDKSPWLPVAYDFDYACLVNAPYVYPKVEDNRTLRMAYLGFRENEKYISAIKKLFIDKKDAIIDYVKNFEGLSKNDLRACLQYIKGFYRDIEDDDFVIPYKT